MDHIGSSCSRIDAVDKVIGTTKFPSDLFINEDFLHIGAVRSPFPHAIVKNIDTRMALKHPDVTTVLLAKDIDGPNRYGLMSNDKPVLADHKVRCVGDPVALVVANNNAAAIEASNLVKVEYQELPALFDPIEASLESSIRIGDKETNVVVNYNIIKGNLNLALKNSFAVVENSYQTTFNEVAFLQPEAGVATIDKNGCITVWAATQWGAVDRDQIAYALGMPQDKITVIQPAIGGAFGGREDISVQIFLALAALKTGKSVKMVYSREESFISHGKRHPFIMNYKTGADKSGKLTALEVKMIADAGAYESTSKQVLAMAVALATGPYNIPNVKIDGQAVLTNNPWTCALRGFGSPQPCFAYEGQMDRLAYKLGIDPVTFRQLNLMTDGSSTGCGQIIENGVSTSEILNKVIASSGWNPKQTRIKKQNKKDNYILDKTRGTGIACGWKNIGFVLGFHEKSTATVEIDSDCYKLFIDVSDVGQGIATALTQIAAQELGVPYTNIEFITGNTRIAPDGGPSSASRQIFVSGNAVRLAAKEAQRLWESLGKNQSVLPLRITRTYEAPATTPLHPDGGFSAPIFCYAYSAQLVEIEVDQKTGEIEIIRVISGHDVGKAINPQGIEAQIDGGVVMGIGHALFEEYLVKNGIHISTDYANYLIPTSLDIPKDITYEIIETPDPEGPYGAKGIGELPLLPIIPALASAIYDATGIWVNKLPISPELLV